MRVFCLQFTIPTVRCHLEQLSPPCVFSIGKCLTNAKGKSQTLLGQLFKAVHVHKEGTCTHQAASHAGPLFIQSLEEGQARQAQDIRSHHCGPC